MMENVSTNNILLEEINHDINYFDPLIQNSIVQIQCNLVTLNFDSNRIVFAIFGKILCFQSYLYGDKPLIVTQHGLDHRQSASVLQPHLSRNGSCPRPYQVLGMALLTSHPAHLQFLKWFIIYFIS